MFLRENLIFKSDKNIADNDINGRDMFIESYCFFWLYELTKS